MFLLASTLAELFDRLSRHLQCLVNTGGDALVMLFSMWRTTEMCRSIKVLRQPDQPATPDDFNAAALQFVRKISGFRKPSKANQESFERAVVEVAEASRKLLQSIEQAH